MARTQKTNPELRSSALPYTMCIVGTWIIVMVARIARRVTVVLSLLEKRRGAPIWRGYTDYDTAGLMG
jgi:hypothetical protein